MKPVSRADSIKPGKALVQIAAYALICSPVIFTLIIKFTGKYIPDIYPIKILVLPVISPPIAYWLAN